MIKLKIPFMTLITILYFTGCGAYTAPTTLDLSGTWRQINNNSEDTYQIAAIDSDTITIYWYTPSDSTTALYWTGTFTPPEHEKSYSWDSENYHTVTDYALLASGDDTKTINYSNGQISYEISMLGISTTVLLEKTEELTATTKKPSITSSNASDQTNTIVDNSTPKASSSEDIEAVSEQLDFKALPTLEGDVCMFITNNSNTIIDELEIQLNYLDEFDNVIDLESDGHDLILPGHTVVSKLSAPKVFADARLQYHLQLDIFSGYTNHSNEITVKTSQGNDCIIIQLTNNSNVTIDEIEYIVVLYKGNDIAEVCFPQDVYDLGAGQTTTEKESTYGTSYDRFEVYLNQAHTFW